MGVATESGGRISGRCFTRFDKRGTELFGAVYNPFSARYSFWQYRMTVFTRDQYLKTLKNKPVRQGPCFLPPDADAYARFLASAPDYRAAT
jgi:hypothetical protein